MLNIRYTPGAERDLQLLPATSRRLVAQLAKALGELAQIYPASAPVWGRLGAVDRRRITVEVARCNLTFQLDSARRGVKILAVIPRVEVLELPAGRGRTPVRRRKTTPSRSRGRVATRQPTRMSSTTPPRRVAASVPHAASISLPPE